MTDPAAPLLFAVIPTVLVGGPLAVLALLFPGLFGGWSRWLALLSTLTTIASIYALQWWFSARLIGSWWGTPSALSTLLSLVSLLGLFWAGLRHLRAVRRGEASLLASRWERLALGLMSLVGLLLVLASVRFQQSLFSPMWLPVLACIVAVWLGSVYVGWTWWRGPRLVPALSTESVVLAALSVTLIGLTPLLAPPTRSLESAQVVEPTLRWSFRLPRPGAFASSPVVVGQRVLIAAAIDELLRPYGELFCLDRDSGKVVWSFSDQKQMKPIFSTPTVVDEFIYIGEGFHLDFACKIYCLSLHDGSKRWEYQTASHTEASPTVVEDRVFVGAGDDGVIALRANDGRRQWKFSGYHVDATPAYDADRLFVGAGIGDVHRTTALLCLEAGTGQPLWRVATAHSIWGKPLIRERYVYFGTGNGRLNEAADRPEGEIHCLEARSGASRWQQRLPDAILGSLALDAEQLYAGCRDGRLYALRRSDGQILWSRQLGSSLIASPVSEREPPAASLGNRVYAASLDGLLAAVDAATGRVLWHLNLQERTRVPIELVATPALELRAEGRRLYVALTTLSSGRAAELLCFEEPFAP